MRRLSSLAASLVVLGAIGCKQAEPDAIRQEPPAAWEPEYLPKLAGLWLGDYGVDGQERVRIQQEGALVFATKETGDARVPAGKPTFRARLDGREGEGQAHVAEAGYVNPIWVPGHLKVLSSDVIAFTLRDRPTLTFVRVVD